MFRKEIYIRIGKYPNGMPYVQKSNHGILVYEDQYKKIAMAVSKCKTVAEARAIVRTPGLGHDVHHSDTHTPKNVSIPKPTTPRSVTIPITPPQKKPNPPKVLSSEYSNASTYSSKPNPRTLSVRPPPPEIAMTEVRQQMPEEKEPPQVKISSE